MNFHALFLMVALAGYLAYAEETCTSDNKTFARGEVYHPPGKCLQEICVGQNYLTAVGCSSIDAPPSCTYIPQNNSKPYPECCPKYKCK